MLVSCRIYANHGNNILILWTDFHGDIAKQQLVESKQRRHSAAWPHPKARMQPLCLPTWVQWFWWNICDIGRLLTSVTTGSSSRHGKHESCWYGIGNRTKSEIGIQTTRFIIVKSMKIERRLNCKSHENDDLPWVCSSYAKILEWLCFVRNRPSLPIFAGHHICRSLKSYFPPSLDVQLAISR